MTRLLLALALTVPLLAGCAGIPDVAAQETAASRDGAYPDLAPLPDLLARAEAPTRVSEAERELAARSAGLKSRAAQLRQKSE